MITIAPHEYEALGAATHEIQNTTLRVLVLPSARTTLYDKGLNIHTIGAVGILDVLQYAGILVGRNDTGDIEINYTVVYRINRSTKGAASSVSPDYDTRIMFSHRSFSFVTP